MNNSASPARRNGFTMVELLVGMVISALLLAASYRLWSNSQWESLRLKKKTALRTQMALCSKHIQRSITLAGLGLKMVPNIQKLDDIDSDTLIIYTNMADRHTLLRSDFEGGNYRVPVDNPSIFQITDYMAISDGSGGEMRRILSKDGSYLVLASPLIGSYARVSATVSPARQEKFYVSANSSGLVCRVNNRLSTLAKDIRSFQVSFRNAEGEDTEGSSEIRSVIFTFTGHYPAKAGAIGSVIFQSTAIPRNSI